MNSSGLKKVKRLGKGFEGTVWLMQHKETGKLYARKKLQHWTTVDLVPVEVHIRRHCMPYHHRSLLDFHGYHFICSKREEHCKLLYEYCAGGDLDNLIAKDHLPESFIWHVFIQLAEALDAMHYRGPQHVVHRDIKPNNINFKIHAQPQLSHSQARRLRLCDHGANHL